jgi:carbon-monoxide dehydrogenase medium subunit
VRQFDYVAVRSIKEAVSVLQENGERARVLAGGTDILVQMRAGRRSVDVLVDIKGIPDVNALEYGAGKGLIVGAAVPCCRIYEDKQVASLYPGLIDSASLIGGTQIQGRASLGGNLCNAAPSADGVPPLIVLGALCVVAGPEGAREVLVEQFCTAPGRNILKPGEFLVSFRIPPPQPASGARYLRFIPRNEMDIAVAGVGAAVVLDGHRRTIKSARVALSAVAPTPLLVEAAGAELAGRPISDEAIERAADAVAKAARPITDMRGTVEQRRHLVRVLTRRALQGAIQRAREA